MTLSPEGNRRIQLPLGVVPTNRADSDPTRSGACGRGTEDLATRERRDFRLDVCEASRFLTFSEELGGLTFSATVEDESVAVFSALSGTSLGGGSVFSAGEDPAPCNASLACDGPSAGAGGSTARLLIANWGEAEPLSTSGLAGLASPSGFTDEEGGGLDCCVTPPECSVSLGEASEAVWVLLLTASCAGGASFSAVSAAAVADAICAGDCCAIPGDCSPC